MSKNFDILSAKIIELSEADSWEEAKLEWVLDNIYKTSLMGSCLCTQSIVEHCVLLNKENGNEAIVGNVCVQKFLGLPSGPIFRGVNRLIESPSKPMSEHLVYFCDKKGWLTGWEYSFCLNMAGRRKLTFKQTEKIQQINRKMLTRFKR
jgi:hypothetical protein